MATSEPDNGNARIPNFGGEGRQVRDVVVVGASAGGIEAVQRLFSDLGRQDGAAFLVVIHLAPDAHSALPNIIGRQSPMPVRHAEMRERLTAGVVYVARPDFHLLLEGSEVVLSHGPRENRHRPSIDALFRSAAESYGPRVVGVVLSGNLRDGAAGLDAINSVGGVAVIEEPADASYAGMPLAAMSAVPDAHVVRLAEIGGFLASLLPSEAHLRGQPMETHETSNASSASALPPNEEHPASIFTCPDCGGTLFRVDEGEGRVISFHCRVGHRYSSESLFEAQEEAVEEALWASLRAMEERADLAKTMAERAREGRREHAEKFFARKAAEANQRINALRKLLDQAAMRQQGFPETDGDDEAAGVPGRHPGETAS